MKRKEDLKLRKVGNQYMVVDVSGGSADLSMVYTMNETAAWLWEKIGDDGCEAGKLAEGLCEVYEVDKETALHDVEKQIEEWKKFGLVV